MGWPTDHTIPYLVDGVTIPGANLPPLFIPHQLSLCIAIPGFQQNNHYFISFLKKYIEPPALLQVLTVPLRQHKGGEGKSCRSVLGLLQRELWRQHLCEPKFSFQGCAHPCLPCAHPPLVEPVAKGHGADQAAKDDRGIEHLETKVFFSTKEIRTCLAGILRKLIGA